MVVPETEIIVSHDGAEILRKTVPPGEYVIGREAACDLQVEIALVSRRHAQLTVNYDHVLIQDLGSSNGTLVNGQPVTESTRLWPNQKIQIGAATIELHRINTPPPPDVSLAPSAAAVQRLLPEALLRDQKYAIGKVVAQGGMGAILDAREAAIERRVAMKVMLDSSDPDALARFVAEAKITGQLEHPGIVPIYELSVDEHGQPFYTMKMVRGITLKKVLDLLAEGTAATLAKYPLPALLTIFQKVCDALAFAHSRGVIHRDLKPENLMLDDFGVVLVMDWGLAKRIADTEKRIPERTEANADGASEPNLSGFRFPQSGIEATLVGTIMGTPAFMSPEQARGEIDSLDARSDLYALGAILYQILALRPPVRGHTAMDIVAKVQRGEIEPLVAVVESGRPSPLPHLPGGRIPPSLAAIVGKAMAFDPAARYARTEELQADLLAYQNGFATSAENAGAWKQFTLLVKRNKALFGSAAAAAVSIAVVVGVAFQQVTGERNVAVGERKIALQERNRAETALTSLAKTAPTFAAMAKGLVEQGNLEGALEKIGYAVSLEKGNADYLLQQANLLQATQQLAAAAESYRAVLALRADRAAKLNLELCEKLLRDNAGGSGLKRESQESLVSAMMQQGRAVEAAPLSNILGKGSDTALAAIKARLKPLLAITGPGAGASRLPNGTFLLNLDYKPVVELPALDGLPITEVSIANTKVSDLTPLKGLRLRVLRISNTPVTDLSPLAGMPLEVLDASVTKIKDITPLKGMPVKELYLSGNHGFFELSPLRGMALEKLNVSSTSVGDLRSLAGTPMENLDISNTGVSDLSPLAEMPLNSLQASSTKVTNLSPLRGCPLQSLWLTRSPVSDLSPLAGMRIGHLNITGTKVTDISVVRTLPLWGLSAQCPVKDLRPVADCKTLTILEISKVTSDISFLRALPKLRRLTDEPNWGQWVSKDAPSAEQFWQQYDAQAPLRVAREEVAAALPALGMAKGETTIVVPWGVSVSLYGLPVAGITGLRPLPIDFLHLAGTKVTNLAPLRGMRLKNLTFDKTAVKDVSPLLDMPILEAAMVTQGATNLGVLRDHPTLKWLGWEGDWDAAANRPNLTTAEFWARYDKQQAAGKK